ncbi:MAG: hypothetical protein WD802_12335 [Gemmatimonadaceae bacterium]
MRIFLPALLLLSAGCAELPRLEPSLSERDWNIALAETRRNVDAGNYYAADRILAEFARRHPDTREARETAFWRAAYLVDPANPLGSLEIGIAALDAYLASEPQGWYRDAAEVLRHTAAGAHALAIGARTGWAPDTVVLVAAPDSAPPPRRSRDEEIAALRDQLARSNAELAKANAELDRIKKRLANPSP